MVRVVVSESESLQCMIIKTQIHQCSPPWMQNQTFKNERVFRNNALTNKFCWDILLHVNEKSKNKVEKDKKNLSIFNEVLANNISPSTASISKSLRLNNRHRTSKSTRKANFPKRKGECRIWPYF